MSGGHVVIDLSLQAGEAIAGLDRLAAGMDDLSPVMEDIAELLLASTRERFTQGAAPDGTAWAPKSAATIAAYLRRGDRADPRPLFGPSGALSSTISTQADAASAEVGSNLVYAAAMQFGAARGAFGANARGNPIPWGDIPARPFLGLSADDGAGLLDIVGEWLERLAGDGAG